ncbi:MAG: hypothetical protein GY721_06540 [Deltaproteobacteria bacterium]|nr:hypothetical protein [Deltaproteobacteria bacterium]
MPNNIKLPFFAYGLFKPGQVCFFRIKELVKNVRAAEVNGILKERDGIPLLVRDSYSRINGVVIYFENRKDTEAYERIAEIEPDEVYCWKEVNLNNDICANVLLGRRPDRGSSDLEHFEEWDGRTDPFFKDALEEVEAILKNNAQFQGNYKALFRLQMAYSLLWAGLERYAGLRYHLGKNANKKVLQIAKECVFAESLKTHVKDSRIIFSSADL